MQKRDRIFLNNISCSYVAAKTNISFSIVIFKKRSIKFALNIVMSMVQPRQS